jgi:hypothetical protein
VNSSRITRRNYSHVIENTERTLRGSGGGGGGESPVRIHFYDKHPAGRYYVK